MNSCMGIGPTTLGTISWAILGFHSAAVSNNPRAFCLGKNGVEEAQFVWFPTCCFPGQVGLGAVSVMVMVEHRRPVLPSCDGTHSGA